MAELGSCGNKMVLFDMDGTITPPRECADIEVILALQDLMLNADIAIVSGSEFSYIEEQMAEHLPNYSMAGRIIIMPCNGTQIYRYINDQWQQIYSVSMKDEVGNELYNRLISEILSLQLEFMNIFPEFNVSGNFISYRESTLNWSFIGRNSSKKDRAFFANHPDNEFIRETFIELLNLRLRSGKIECALGGQTSIDIYPKGWDKTYALRHFEGKECWFVGDRCEPGQNDYHIWSELNKEGRSFKTSGPEETIGIIDNLIGSFSSRTG